MSSKFKHKSAPSTARRQDTETSTEESSGEDGKVPLTEKVILQEGLIGMDGHIEKLTTLWEELQLCSVDVAHPSLDLLTFAETCFYLGVISLKPDPRAPPPGEASKKYGQWLADNPDIDREWNSAQWPKPTKPLKVARRPAPQPGPSNVTPSQGFIFEMDLPGETVLSPKARFLSGLDNPIASEPNIQISETTIEETNTRFFSGLDPIPSATSGQIPGTTVEHNQQAETTLEDTSTAQPVPSFSEASTVTQRYLDVFVDGKDPEGFQDDERQSKVWAPPEDNWDHRHPEWADYDDPSKPGYQPYPTTLPGGIQYTSSSDWTRDVPETPSPVGLVYLTATPLAGGDDQVGELNIGIILDTDARGKGHAKEVLGRVLEMAFNQRRCHRIQAAVLERDTKEQALFLFTQMKFGHEGTRRLSFFSPLEQEWKDVTYLALLATDWAMRLYLKPAPKSLWDEMFARHAREREALLRWDESRLRKLNRTSSMETIVPTHPSVGDSDAEAGMSDADVYNSAVSSPRREPARSVSPSPPPTSPAALSASKGKKREAPHLHDADHHDAYAYDASSSAGEESDFDGEQAWESRSRKIGRFGAASPTSSVSSSSHLSVPPSVRSDSEGSSWDMVDALSTSTSEGGETSGSESGWSDGMA
ncbi:hypothetical protein HGRIS_000313 [Hohenbuehelia grisea]|uniref:N-acetyltransferase domain-containing protein n=1 Tax=Hohenbuehelia grisea TaxID=104357 RepID=A0ABR3JRG4_9AGAR